MATLGTLVIELNANVAKLQQDMGRASSVVERNMASIRSAAASAGKALAAIGVGVGVAGMAALVKQTIDFADNLSKTSQKIGVSVEALSALKYAADLADVSFEQLSTGVRQLSRQMANALSGSKEAIQGFGAIGVAVQNADGSLRDTEAVLNDVADAFQKLPDGATKTAIAMRLFGRAGADLIPLLNAGSDGIEDLRKEAESFGLIISTETARQAEEFNDSLTRLKAAGTGVTIAITSGILPAVTSLAVEFVRAYTEAEGLLKVFNALGTAVSRVSGGNDQRRLGELLLQEIEIEQQLARLESGVSQRISGSRTRDESIAKTKAALEAVRSQIRGLETVLQPEQRGAGKPLIDPGVADEAARRERERQAALALAQDDNAKTRQKEQERQLKAQEDYLNALNRQVVLEGQSTELAKVNADIKFGAASKFTVEVQASARALADQLDILKESAEVHEYLLGVERERRVESAAAVKAKQEEVQATIESLRTPLEQYAAAVQKLVALELDDVNLQRGIEAARKELETAQEKAKEVDDTVKDLGLTFSSAFEEAILGANSLRDVLDGLLKDIARVLLRKTVIEPLLGVFTKSLEGGALGGLFGNAKGGLYKVGGSGSEHPVAFTAKAGEIVAVGTGMQSGGGGLSVVVNNYSSERVNARESRDPSGRRQLEIMVGELTAGNIGSGRLAPLGFAPALAAR